MITIAEKGDIVLIVDKLEVQLRVDSYLLRAASAPLNVMFGPHFKEGQGLDPNKPKDIRLEEDDSEAMILICQVIHHKNASVSKKIPAKLLGKTAQLADKYLLQDTMCFAIEKWFEVDDEQDLKDLGTLLDVAIKFRLERGFQNAIRQLVLNIADSYEPLVAAAPSMEYVKVLYAVESKRNELRMKILEAYDDAIATANSYSQIETCGCCQEYEKDLVQFTTDQEVHPRAILQRSVFASVTRARDPPTPDSDRCPRSCDYCHGEPHNIRQKLLFGLSREFIEDFRGLELTHDVPQCEY